MMRALCYWMRQFVKKQLNEVSHGKNLATVITLALNKRTKSILFNRLFFQSQGKTKVIQILFQKSKSLQEKLWVFNFFFTKCIERFQREAPGSFLKNWIWKSLI